jgi:parallel beta-helix repeat protein
MPRIASHLFALSILWTVQLHGRDLHVSPQGDNKAEGSVSAPLQTVQFACDHASSGDVLHVAPGLYNEKLIIKTSCQLIAEPGAILSGKAVKGENIILIENVDNVGITGFEIRDHAAKDGSGIRVRGGGKDIVIRNNRIHEIRGRDAMGITVYGTDSKRPIDGIIIDGNEIFDCDPAKSEALTLNGNVSNFQVTRNIVHDVNNIGIDMIGGEKTARDHSLVARDGVCSGNTVYRCRSHYEDGYAAGIYVDGGRDIVLENNIVTQCDLGIEIGAENKGTIASGIRVRGNTVFHNDKAGIVFGGYDKNTGRVQNCQFTNNICYQNNRHKNDHNGELWIQWASDNVISGNTFVVNGSDSPLANIVRGAGTNSFNSNHYYTDAGSEDAFFLYHDSDVNGFAAWRAKSGDADSVFGPVEVKLPKID